MTLTGKVIGNATVVINQASAPTVGGSIIGSNAVTTVIGTNLTTAGIVQSLNGTVTNALTLTGSDLADTLNGGDGNDTITGAAGSDSLVGGAGSDSIVAGDGGDSIVGGAGSDNINAGTGDDVIYGGTDIDTITAGSGSDTIYFHLATATTGSQTLVTALAGSDSVYLGTSGTATDGSVDHIQWGYDAGTITNVDATSAAASMIAGLKADGVKHIYGFDTSDVIEFKTRLLTSSGGNVNDATGGAKLLELAATANFAASDAAATSAPFIEITGTADLNATSAQNVTSVAALLTGTVQSQMKAVFAIDDGTDSYLWYFDGSVGATDAAASAAIATAELTLIGVVHNYNDFSAGDFAVIA